MSTVTEYSWAKDLLTRMGYPVNQNNVTSVLAWEYAEGGHFHNGARFNPLNTDDALPYSEVDVQGRVMDPRLTEPTWSGLTSDGSRLNISAAEARLPAEGRPAEISALRADLVTPDGVTMHLQSTAGRYDEARQSVTFTGPVRVNTSSGYDIRMTEATAYRAAGVLTGNDSDPPQAASCPSYWSRSQVTDHPGHRAATRAGTPGWSPLVQ